jgi:hypothetical protein
MHFIEVRKLARVFVRQFQSRAAGSAWRLFFFVLPILGLLPAQAQFNASLSGTVTDQTGAIIPGATVTLVDKETNQTRTTTTSPAGLFDFNALAPDHYSLSVERQGFKKRSVDQVVLIPEQPNVLNMQMELGNVSETVTVNGSAAPLLDTGTATLSATINSEEIQHLPSFNRDVFQLAQLAPGAFGDASQGSAGGSYELPPATRDRAGQQADLPASSKPKTDRRFRHGAANMKPTGSRSTASAP